MRLWWDANSPLLKTQHHEFNFLYDTSMMSFLEQGQPWIPAWPGLQGGARDTGGVVKVHSSAQLAPSPSCGILQAGKGQACGGAVKVSWVSFARDVGER